MVTRKLPHPARMSIHIFRKWAMTVLVLATCCSFVCNALQTGELEQRAVDVPAEITSMQRIAEHVYHAALKPGGRIKSNDRVDTTLMRSFEQHHEKSKLKWVEDLRSGERTYLQLYTDINYIVARINRNTSLIGTKTKSRDIADKNLKELEAQITQLEKINATIEEGFQYVLASRNDYGIAALRVRFPPTVNFDPIFHGEEVRKLCLKNAQEPFKITQTSVTRKLSEYGTLLDYYNQIKTSGYAVPLQQPIVYQRLIADRDGGGRIFWCVMPILISNGNLEWEKVKGASNVTDLAPAWEPEPRFWIAYEASAAPSEPPENYEKFLAQARQDQLFPKKEGEFNKLKDVVDEARKKDSLANWDKQLGDFLAELKKVQASVGNTHKEIASTKRLIDTLGVEIRRLEADNEAQKITLDGKHNDFKAHTVKFEQLRTSRVAHFAKSKKDAQGNKKDSEVLVDLIAQLLTDMASYNKQQFTLTVKTETKTQVIKEITEKEATARIKKVWILDYALLNAPDVDEAIFNLAIGAEIQFDVDRELLQKYPRPKSLTERYKITVNEVVDYNDRLVWRAAPEKERVSFIVARRMADVEARNSSEPWRIPEMKDYSSLAELVNLAKDSVSQALGFKGPRPGNEMPVFWSSTVADKKVDETTYQCYKVGGDPEYYSDVRGSALVLFVKKLDADRN